jgi:hypothetical protein
MLLEGGGCKDGFSCNAGGYLTVYESANCSITPERYSVFQLSSQPGTFRDPNFGDINASFGNGDVCVSPTA